MGFLGFGGYGGGASSLAVAGGAPDEWGTDDDGRSIRFEPADSSYLSRTFDAGNQQKWTFSCWVKRAAVDTSNYTLFSADNSGTDFLTIRYEQNQIRVDAQGDGQGRVQVTTTNTFLDAAAWYHVVVALDTTQGTAANRCKIYTNGVQQDTSNTFSQNKNFAVNDTNSHEIGRRSDGNDNHFSGLLSEIHFIDDAQLAASSFGSEDSDGIWNPTVDLSGLDYGDTGFYLKFDNAAAIGDDRSSLNNDWTVNNLTGTDGSNPHNIDFLFDHPISDGTDNRAGGEIRGNYCTLNPLDAQSGVALKQGNLRMDSSGDASCRGTIPNVDQKWYFEATVTGGPGASQVGVHNANIGVEQFTSDHMDYRIDNGEIYGGSGSHPGTTFGVGDTIGVAVNKADGTGTISFYKNGSLVQTRNLSAATNDNPVVPNTRTPSSGTIDFNFGQRAFRNAAPSGYKCWAAPNLAAPAITKPKLYFDAVTYEGTGSDGNEVNGLAFNPEAVWIKDREDNNHGRLYDKIRGVNSAWLSSSTNQPEQYAAYGQFESFDSDGFTVGAGTGNAEGTNDTTGHVAWCWDAGTSAASPKSGGSSQTITASNSWVNTTSKFELIKYSTGGSAGNVGHNLNAVPKFIIIKSLGNTNINAPVYHDDMNGTSSHYLVINDSFGGYKTDAGSIWNGINPTNEVFGVGSHNMTGGGSYEPYIAWVWAEVDGYSKFGTYTGSGGEPFVHLGFRPRYFLLRRSDNNASWYIFDSARSPYNPVNKSLKTNQHNAEGTYSVDFVSNGVQINASGDGDINGSGANYIYAAFAEHPFKLTRAR